MRGEGTLAEESEGSGSNWSYVRFSTLFPLAPSFALQVELKIESTRELQTGAKELRAVRVC